MATPASTQHQADEFDKVLAKVDIGLALLRRTAAVTRKIASIEHKCAKEVLQELESDQAAASKTGWAYASTIRKMHTVLGQRATDQNQFAVRLGALVGLRLEADHSRLERVRKDAVKEHPKLEKRARQLVDARQKQLGRCLKVWAELNLVLSEHNEKKKRGFEQKKSAKYFEKLEATLIDAKTNTAKEFVRMEETVAELNTVEAHKHALRMHLCAVLAQIYGMERETLDFMRAESVAAQQAAAALVEICEGGLRSAAPTRQRVMDKLITDPVMYRTDLPCAARDIQRHTEPNQSHPRPKTPVPDLASIPMEHELLSSSSSEAVSEAARSPAPELSAAAPAQLGQSNPLAGDAPGAAELSASAASMAAMHPSLRSRSLRDEGSAAAVVQRSHSPRARTPKLSGSQQPDSFGAQQQQQQQQQQRAPPVAAPQPKQAAAAPSFAFDANFDDAEFDAAFGDAPIPPAAAPKGEAPRPQSAVAGGASAHPAASAAAVAASAPVSAAPPSVLRQASSPGAAQQAPVVATPAREPEPGSAFDTEAFGFGDDADFASFGETHDFGAPAAGSSGAAAAPGAALGSASAAAPIPPASDSGASGSDEDDEEEQDDDYVSASESESFSKASESRSGAVHGAIPGLEAFPDLHPDTHETSALDDVFGHLTTPPAAAPPAAAPASAAAAASSSRLVASPPSLASVQHPSASLGPSQSSPSSSSAAAAAAAAAATAAGSRTSGAARHGIARKDNGNPFYVAPGARPSRELAALFPDEFPEAPASAPASVAQQPREPAPAARALPAATPAPVAAATPAKAAAAASSASSHSDASGDRRECQDPTPLPASAQKFTTSDFETFDAFGHSAPAEPGAAAAAAAAPAPASAPAASFEPGSGGFGDSEGFPDMFPAFDQPKPSAASAAPAIRPAGGKPAGPGFPSPKPQAQPASAPAPSTTTEDFGFGSPGDFADFDTEFQF